MELLCAYVLWWCARLREREGANLQILRYLCAAVRLCFCTFTLHIQTYQLISQQQRQHSRSRSTESHESVNKTKKVRANHTHDYCAKGPHTHTDRQRTYNSHTPDNRFDVCACACDCPLHNLFWCCCLVPTSFSRFPFRLERVRALLLLLCV